MDIGRVLRALAAAGALVAGAGCTETGDDDSAGDDDAGDDDAGDDDVADDDAGDDDAGDNDAGDDDAGDDDAGEPSFGSGSNFDSVDGMLAYVNQQRQGYWVHDRWRGLPFYGSYHTTFTWPDTFVWDEGLAAEAQIEADAVAGGAPPTGVETLANPGTEHLWIDGVDTARYMVTGREMSGIWDTQESALGCENAMMRMGMYYQDPGGGGPVLSSIGIGASDAGGGHTWWVMVLE